MWTSVTQVSGQSNAESSLKSIITTTSGNIDWEYGFRKISILSDEMLEKRKNTRFVYISTNQNWHFCLPKDGSAHGPLYICIFFGGQITIYVTSDTVLLLYFYMFHTILNTFCAKIFCFAIRSPLEWHICNTCHFSAIYVIPVSDICML